MAREDNRADNATRDAQLENAATIQDRNNTTPPPDTTRAEDITEILDRETEESRPLIVPDGEDVRTVHCKNVEHVNDQRKRRNAISKYAGFPPPMIKILFEIFY